MFDSTANSVINILVTAGHSLLYILVSSTPYVLVVSMQAQRDDIANLKEDMAKLVRHLTPIGGN